MMHQHFTHRDFTRWRDLARQLLAAQVPPTEVLWADWESEGSLFTAPVQNEATPGELPDARPLTLALPPEYRGEGSARNEPTAPDATASVQNEPTVAPRVPSAFLELAKVVACHREADRWNLLYRSLWRLTHGEPELLERLTDDDVMRMHAMEKDVRRDRHKMTAFVRFQKVIDPDGGEQYVAWHRPDHYIVRLTAPFFRGRFAAMRWTILTPDDSVAWDPEQFGQTLQFGPGVPESQAPRGDELESLWRTYYANIFNPARIKIGAMKKELPVRHWPTLPETQLIPDLLADAPRRVQEMMRKAKENARPGSGPRSARMRNEAAPVAGPPGTDTESAPDLFSKSSPAEETRGRSPRREPPGKGAAKKWGAEQFIPPTRSLKVLAEASKECRGCDLCEVGTQTVFGEGPKDALVMFVGEQPGDQEDRAGKPFVGPAGQLLDSVLQEVGIIRDDCYVTNAVKHFKWEPRGTRRIHAKPNAREVSACQPWLVREIELIQPKVLVCLGSTAAQSLLGRDFRVTQRRGEVMETEWSSWTIATVHPSALLRIPDEALRLANRKAFTEDLQKVAAQVAKLKREG